MNDPEIQNKTIKFDRTPGNIKTEKVISAPIRAF